MGQVFDFLMIRSPIRSPIEVATVARVAFQQPSPGARELTYLSDEPVSLPGTRSRSSDRTESRRSPPSLSRPLSDSKATWVNCDGRPTSNSLDREARSEIDRELVERAKNGDARAFRQLVERHQRRAFGIALALLRDEEDAREVVQEAFVRVHRGLSEFKGGSAFFTWLYRIVHNLAIDWVRRPSRRELDLEGLLAAESAGDSSVELMDTELVDRIHREELQERIRSALEELPAYHRGVILMREVYGMSYEEMATSMGVSKGTIMSRLFHARRKLQKSLAVCYEETFGVKALEKDAK